MKLIVEIIDILSSNDGSITNALIKTKILLHKIGQKELVGWVNNELNGYPDDDKLPPYRILPAQVLGNLANLSYQLNEQPIPVLHLDEDYRKRLQTARIDHSLAVLEKFAESDDQGSLSTPIPLEANALLGKQLTSGYQIQKAWCEISLSGITQILTQVRSRLLDFLLELNEKIGDDLTDEEVKEKANTEDAENLFNNAIFGDNTTIVVGSSNTQTVGSVVVSGDFNSLSDILTKNGVEENDISSLKTAIEEDKELVDEKNRQFGPSVKAWLQIMFAKAVDTSWKIELGITSSLLANALQKYYGWF